MSKQAYKSINFRDASLERIDQINVIIRDYQRQGYDLTLRQLYYQLVSRAIIENNAKSYKNVGSLVNDARLAGLIDWDAIVDRTRNLRGGAHWDNPESILRDASGGYAIDKWEGQDFRPEVWIEKDALVGVISPVCSRLDISYFSCRGYVSQSEMREAGERFIRYRSDGQEPLIIHLGDHDPSGLDMTRDITERMRMFADGIAVEVRRIALNMDQIQQYNPPPNFAKDTDARYQGYQEEYGEESYELDALNPTVMAELIETAVLSVRDDDVFNERVEQQDEERRRLARISNNYASVVAFLDELEDA